MAKCVNCELPAVYAVSDRGALPADFCAADLPAHLQARADAGDFTVEVPEVAVEKPALVSKK